MGSALIWRTMIGTLGIAATLSYSVFVCAETVEPQVYPKVSSTSKTLQDHINRGEYLAKSGDCVACHTAPNGVPFAGGLAIKTPFGTIYSPNITPDKETGIGSWSDADFIKAMREGKSPAGSYYFPVFPYTFFNKMTEQDLIDIKAYLNAIPAVKNQNKDPDMPIPFRWRFMQLGWRTMFFTLYKGEFQPNPNQSAQWNRGAYLVEGPGHCAMCHSPLNFLGSPKRQYHLTGGFVDGFYAPNISSTGLEKFSAQQIKDVFLNNNRLGGGKIVAKPMLEVNYDSLRYMSNDDLDAIIVYLKTVKNKTPPVQTRSVDSGSGKKIYDKYCSACHVTGAGGAPKIEDKTAWAPRIATGKTTLYKTAISGMGSMPPKGACPDCTDDEIQAAVDYIVNQVGGEAGAQGGAEKAAAQPSVQLTQPTLEQGKKIYDQVCSSCHNTGVLNAPKLGDKKAWESLIKKNIDVLLFNTVHGYKGNPVRGACNQCSDADLLAAVKYMVQESRTKGDYRLW